MFVRSGIALTLCLAACQALSHSETQDGVSHPLAIDCEHPAVEVATNLPPVIAETATLQCTPAMQAIVAGGNWTWRYPGSFFDRPFIPAYAPEASHGRAGARFFTRFETRELTAEEIGREHERFARDVPTYREAATPSKIIRLVATNDLGHPLDAYFGFRSETEGWVVLCTPTCEPSNLFLMQKIQ